MFGVICLHTTHLYNTSYSLSIADILYKTAVIAIPLFFMTSGYLMFGRKNIDYPYVIKKITNIIKFVFIIIFAYWLLWSIKHQSLDIKILTNYFGGSFIQKGPFYVFWYLGAMVIIYTILPILNYIYEYSTNTFLCLLAALFIICNIIFMYNLSGGGNCLLFKHLDYGIGFSTSV